MVDFGFTGPGKVFLTGSFFIFADWGWSAGRLVGREAELKWLRISMDRISPRLLRD
jgi:hypothetical protein